MFSSLERIDSKALARKVHLWRFGDYGTPLLVFPSSAGMAHEWEYNGLVEVLREHRGNKKAAARALGIHRSTLYAKLRRYGLESAEECRETRHGVSHKPTRGRTSR